MSRHFRPGVRRKASSALSNARVNKKVSKKQKATSQSFTGAEI
jgi:hypothetical protein